MTRRARFGGWIFCAAALASWIACAWTACAQNHAGTSSSVNVHLRIVSSLPGKHRAAPAVIWLEPLADTPALPFLPHSRYSLEQKNRTFIPHLQVIPAGSAVEFPNEDPFFHNVFSLFEGKRFDLGLYEAGSSKSVVFSKAGISYIFCNIHPEMSAVVIALDTPLYAIADAKDSVSLQGVPPGDYELRAWIEGVPKPLLDGLSHSVHLSNGTVDLGELKAPIAGGRTMPHTNVYGQEYAPDRQSPYSPH